MFIIFLKSTKEIISYGTGNPTVVGNTLVLNGNSICNDLGRCDWKYIDNQELDQNEYGFVHDADYYLSIEKPLTIAELQEQLAATNAILLDIYLGV